MSNNSVRTLINYLEKFKLINEDITYDIVVDICTNISFNIFNEYISLCKTVDCLNKAIKKIYSIYNVGFSVIDILDNFFIFVKITKNLNENIVKNYFY